MKYNNLLIMLSFRAFQTAKLLGVAPASQAMASRGFAKKGRKSKKASESQSESEMDTPIEDAEVHAEPEHVPEPVPVKKAAPAAAKAQAAMDQPLDKSLFQPFALDVAKVQSTPDNKAPSREDTIEGRYAGVLFTTASQKESLYEVYEDMMYLSDLLKHSEMLKMFTENQGVGNREIEQLNKALTETADFSPITLHFLTILAQNKRLVFLPEIAFKYKNLYKQFNKEEKITIISAEALTSAQQSEVLAALKANPENEGKDFTIEYTVDAAIQGGLQMYTESEFMDMSLHSRMMRIQDEVSKLTM